MLPMGQVPLLRRGWWNTDHPGFTSALISKECASPEWANRFRGDEYTSVMEGDPGGTIL